MVDDSELRISEVISRDKGIDVELVRQYRSMDFGEALDRFLSAETKQELIRDGKYFPNPKTFGELCITKGFSLGTMHDYKEEFCETERGRLWYESQFPDHFKAGLRAQRFAHDYVCSTIKGRRRTEAKLRKVRFTG